MKICILSIFILITVPAVAQIINPNSAARSHKTMTIDKIEKSTESTVFTVSIKNEMAQSGWFCADKNILLIGSAGSPTLNLIKSENIPVCPQKHSFKKINEVLTFKLIFGKLPSLLKYVDLKENCNDACFYVNGIILDEALNAEIETAYNYYQNGKKELSAAAFESIVKKTPDYPYGIFYFQLIKIYSELKNKQKTHAWYYEMQKKSIKDKDIYINLTATQKLLQ